MAYRVTIEEVNQRKATDCILTAIRFAHPMPLVKRHVVCRCKCGVLKTIPVHQILYLKLKSCGCLRHKSNVKALTIEQLNKKLKGTKLTVLSFAKPYQLKRGGTARTCLCQCSCGKQKIIHLSSLTAGYTTSCGCSRKGIAKYTKYSHRNIKIYACWKSMLSRCYDKNKKDYKNYGGRGVTVCDEWRYNYQPFLTWCLDNGWQKGLQLDKDKKGDGLLYSPDTCMFVTPKENGNNRRNNTIVEFNGEKMSLKSACDILGYNTRKYDTVVSRMSSGWSFLEAIYIPVGEKRLSNQKP